MANITVLGSGMVGSVLAAEMARDGAHRVTIADRSSHSLAAAVQRAKRIGSHVEPCEMDLSDAAAISGLIADADLVLVALPSSMGFHALQTVINAGHHYCDISFMPENPRTLDALAKKRGVTAIVDCGVAPGMSNLLAGCAAANLDRCDRISIYVGGVPRARSWPFEYKAGFSPADVIEEYTRPARVVEHGQIITKEALSDTELIDLPGIGTLEAFNTDGLRSLTETIDVPHMVEKTLRYPGHAELMRVFRATGLFDTEPITIGESSVSPRDVLAALMFPRWRYEPGEVDMTVLRIIADGEKEGERWRWSWDLIDEADLTTGFSSMARTTALPCAIMARCLLEGRIERHGVVVPELLGDNAALVEHVVQSHRDHGIVYRHHAAKIADR